MANVLTQQWGEVSLSEFERELLERCSEAPNMGETTTTLYEEIADYHDREVIEVALRGLVEHGFMTTSRGVWGRATVAGWPH